VAKKDARPTRGLGLISGPAGGHI